MIEKFSEEEIKQILYELGIKEKGTRTEYIVAEEIKQLREIIKDKPDTSHQTQFGKSYESISYLIALSLNNRVKTNKGFYRVLNSVKESDKEEYIEMFREILAIIKKHNREWVIDNENEEILKDNSVSKKDLLQDRRNNYEWNMPGMQK